MKKLRVVLIGAGNRGEAYTNIMHKMPEKYEVVAVAEPIKSRREYIQKTHNIPSEFCFEDWNPLFDLGKIADVAIVATMDREHYAPAMKAIELKYDVLLEKPVSPSIEECRNLVEASEQNGVKLIVCHVLRYSDMFVKLKSLIDEGKVGDIVSVNHVEGVEHIHQTHSFVRGNWGNTKKSSPMLLQKSCHDIDILQWIIGKKCKKVQSFGSLKHFKKEYAPEGSPEYCIEGCPVGETCPYNAVKVYLDDKDNTWFRTTCAREANPTDEDIIKAISTTQYGKCVYKCDNDVVDNQTVNMLFEDDITVTFSMCAFNSTGRCIHVMGTKGELKAAIDDDNSPIWYHNFETKEKTEINVIGGNGIDGGHGGGDAGIVNMLYDYLTGNYNGNELSEIKISYENHLIVFAAEQSRIDGTVVDMDEFIASLDK